MPGKVDFKWLAENVDILSVASLLNIKLKPSKDGLRGKCPACKSDDDHALEIITETNTFRCWAAPKPADRKCLSGDCTGLYAHAQGIAQFAAGKYLQGHFRHDGGDTSASLPQSTEGRTEPKGTQPAPTTKKQFDPAAFASKLVYDCDEIKTLGLDQKTAQRVLVGWHPRYQTLFIGHRDDTGQPVCFTKVNDIEGLDLPQQLIALSNVVALKRRA